MKIICNQQEFAQLVRACAKTSSGMYLSCGGCVFNGVCAGNGAPEDGDVMSCIEDICEVQGAGADGY